MAHFADFWVKQNFIFLKILLLPVFLVLTKYHCAKCLKKLISRFQEILVSEGHTDRQTWIYRTLPFKAGGPINIFWYSKICSSWNTQKYIQVPIANDLNIHWEELNNSVVVLVVRKNDVCYFLQFGKATCNNWVLNHPNNNLSPTNPNIKILPYSSTWWIFSLTTSHKKRWGGGGGAHYIKSVCIRSYSGPHLD